MSSTDISFCSLPHMYIYRPIHRGATGKSLAVVPIEKTHIETMCSRYLPLVIILDRGNQQVDHEQSFEGESIERNLPVRAEQIFFRLMIAGTMVRERHREKRATRLDTVDDNQGRERKREKEREQEKVGKEIRNTTDCT